MASKIEFIVVNNKIVIREKPAICMCTLGVCMFCYDPYLFESLTLRLFGVIWSSE